jgi:hypothetical protein
MEAPKIVERHGQDVWETQAMDILRREHCMCLHCGRMKPGTPEHCQLAQAFYEICKHQGNAFIMTRCALWVINT